MTCKRSLVRVQCRPPPRLAERASVVGRVFEQAAVNELATEALRPEVARALVALVRKELIRPDHSDLAAGEAFKFRHLLIRDAAYDALPKAERAELHERFADWLERAAGDRVAEYEEVVGYHLEQAHRYRTELGETGERVERLAQRAAERLAAGKRALEAMSFSCLGISSGWETASAALRLASGWERSGVSSCDGRTHSSSSSPPWLTPRWDHPRA